MAASELRISVSCGPTKFETKNCTDANETPQTVVATSTPRSPVQPPMTAMR